MHTINLQTIVYIELGVTGHSWNRILQALDLCPWPKLSVGSGRVSLELSLATKPKVTRRFLACTQDGDREALAELFRKYAKSIRNIGARILRDGMEADDLVQEVFLYLYRKSSLFDCSKGSERSWIFQIVYTQALLRKRYLKASGFYMSGTARREERYAPECERTETYYELLNSSSGYDWKSLLSVLSYHQQETFCLYFLEGYTFQEIAEKLGQSYANVRNHYYRGLEKLRQHLIPGAANRR